MGNLLRRHLLSSAGFRGGGDEAPAFEAFQFDFNDMTADQPPPNGSIPSAWGVAPLISTAVTQGSKHLSGGPWNRTCLFPQPAQTGAEYATGWAFDARSYGAGVDLPAEGWKLQTYWGCYQTGGQDQRWGMFNTYTGTAPDLDLSNPGTGYRCYMNVQTTNVRHYNRHNIDGAEVHVSDESPSGGCQTNYYVWHEITVDYTARTIHTEMHDLQQGGHTNNEKPIMDAETYPLSAHRYFGFHTTADANNQGVKLHHGWLGNLADDFPARLTLDS